jgi:hypothetical protein
MAPDYELLVTKTVEIQHVLFSTFLFLVETQ